MLALLALLNTGALMALLVGGAVEGRGILLLNNPLFAVIVPLALFPIPLMMFAASFKSPATA